MKRLILAMLVLAVAWPADVSARRRKRRRRRRAKTVKVEKQLTGKEKARLQFRTGQSLFRRKKYGQAVEAFEEAYKSWKHKVIEFNIALCYAFLGQKLKAAEFLRKYLSGAKGLERKLPPILVGVYNGTGVLVVNTPDPKAEIFVDGMLVGRGKADVILEIGKRAVDIRLGDRIAARKTIEVVPREERMWDLKEIPKPPTTPQVPQPRVAETRESTTAPTPTPPTTITVRRRAKGVHWAYFTAAVGLALAGAAAGVVMDMQVRKAREDYDTTGNPDSWDRAAMFTKVTVSMWAVTGAAGITAAVLAIFTRWRKYERVTARVSMTPTVAPGMIGLSMEWQR